MQLSERPGNSFAMSAHLFPSFLCKSKIFFSSFLLIGVLLMYGSKWLCHLSQKQVRFRRENLPFTALLSSAGTNFKFILELVGHESPLLCAVFFHQIHDSIVLLSPKNAILDNPVAHD